MVEVSELEGMRVSDGDFEVVDFFPFCTIELSLLFRSVAIMYTLVSLCLYSYCWSTVLPIWPV